MQSLKLLRRKQKRRIRAAQSREEARCAKREDVTNRRERERERERDH